MKFLIVLFGFLNADFALANEFLPLHTCGTDDKVYVDEYDDRFQVDFNWVQTYKQAAARIGGCSGTLITESLFITAKHCRIDVGDYAEFNYEQGEESERFRVTQIAERGRGDWVIVKLAGEPGYTYTPQEIACELPELNEEIYIIGHPARRRKMLSGGDLVYKSSSGYTLGYEADTLGGSSGSGVLNSDGKLIGVHAWGSCEPDMMGYNGGASIKYILNYSELMREIANCPE